MPADSIQSTQTIILIVLTLVHAESDNMARLNNKNKPNTNTNTSDVNSTTKLQQNDHGREREDNTKGRPRDNMKVKNESERNCEDRRWDIKGNWNGNGNGNMEGIVGRREIIKTEEEEELKGTGMTTQLPNPARPRMGKVIVGRRGKGGGGKDSDGFDIFNENNSSDLENNTENDDGNGLEEGEEGYYYDGINESLKNRREMKTMTISPDPSPSPRQRKKILDVMDVNLVRHGRGDLDMDMGMDDARTMGKHGHEHGHGYDKGNDSPSLHDFSSSPKRPVESVLNKTKDYLNDDSSDNEDEGEESQDEDDDSLDGFIVSDNEEISYYDTSNEEIEDEKIIKEVSLSPPSSPAFPSYPGRHHQKQTSPLRNKKHEKKDNKRRPRKEEKEEDGDSSLDDFIVSDDEEPSIHDMSEVEEKEIDDPSPSACSSPLPRPCTPPLRRSPRKGPTSTKSTSERAAPKKPFRESFINAVTSPLEEEEEDETSRQMQEDMAKLKLTSSTAPGDLFHDKKSDISESLNHLTIGDGVSLTESEIGRHSHSHSPSLKNEDDRQLREIEEFLCDFSEPGENENENENEIQEDDDDIIIIEKEKEKEKETEEKQKPIATPSPRKQQQSSATTKTAQKRAEVEERKASRARKKSFDCKKKSLADEFLKALDDATTGGQVQKLAATTGGVRVVWLSTLKSTAGRARWCRIPHSSYDTITNDRSPIRIPTTSTTKHEHEQEYKYAHRATIELAEHIVDDYERLINTITHEYCHLANNMISNNSKTERPHGKGFKTWGIKCQEALREHPIYGDFIDRVTTKHDYKINYKYVWCCEGCGVLFQRHSKSINTDLVRCGNCRGRLVQIQPKPRRKLN